MNRTRFFARVLPVAITCALAGCTSMTYGTGKSPGLQTMEDLAGIAALSKSKQDPIDYEPRPKVVAPPAVAALPPPGSGTGNAALAANWPKDPDQEYARFKADAAAREAAGLPTPKFRLPSTRDPEDRSPESILVEHNPREDALSTREQSARAKKLFADARGAVAVDENGNPVRRYLSDPPPDYRIPDPAAPLEIVDKPKKKAKFKWWWQK